MVVLLGWAATSTLASVGVAYAQAPASPPYISPPAKPLSVKIPPPSPAPHAAPVPLGPMVTVPEGGLLPNEPPPPRQPIRDPVIQTDQGGHAPKQKRE